MSGSTGIVPPPQRPLTGTPVVAGGTLPNVTGAPRTGTSAAEHLGRAAPGSIPTPRPCRCPNRVQDRGLRASTAAGEVPCSVSYVDRNVTCLDCGIEFVHSAADQEFYAQKGFASDPKRCPSCRASRRASRESSGYDVRDIGGPRGYERGDDRPAREYFAVICSRCGNAAQVPFKPRMDRPVYCSDCFRDVQSAEGRPAP